MDRKQVEAIFEILKEEFLSSKVAVKILSHTFLGGNQPLGNQT